MTPQKQDTDGKIKIYRLIQGELAHKVEGCASKIYTEKGIDICYAEDVENLQSEIKRLKEKIERIRLNALEDSLTDKARIRFIREELNKEQR